MVWLAVVLGWVSADGGSPTRLAYLLLVGFLFHVALFVHNDLCDLEIDRTEARRRRFPLVSGVITPKQGWLIVAAALIGTFALNLTLFSPNLESNLLLSAACIFIGLYNGFGKRVRWPPVTDFVQGLGWAAIIVYASRQASSPSALTWLGGAYYSIYIAFLSGIHGALRDLQNDLSCGARTTAIWLGARPACRGPVITRRLFRYAFTLQILMGLVTLISIALFDFGHPDGYVIVIGIVVTFATSCILLYRALKIEDDQERLNLTGAMQMIFACAPAAGLVSGRSPWWVALLTFAVMVVPLVGNARFRHAARHMGKLLRGSSI
jgi:4-hydroxybenzoate polyprenyltransferase